MALYVDKLSQQCLCLCGKLRTLQANKEDYTLKIYGNIFDICT